jgi:hypothetical protein
VLAGAGLQSRVGSDQCKRLWIRPPMRHRGPRGRSTGRIRRRLDSDRVSARLTVATDMGSPVRSFLRLVTSGPTPARPERDRAARRSGRCRSR